MSRILSAAALLALAPLVAFAPVAFAPAAFAHAHLQSATPPVGATVKAAPTEVSIGFTEGVEPAYSGIEVLNATGAHVEAGPAQTAPGDNKHLVVPVRALQPGTYKVQWHATAVDTHKTDGSYSFTVGE